MAKGILAAIFGDNKKKIQKENAGLKNQVRSMIATLVSKANNVATKEKLNALDELLKSQDESNQKEAVELLKKAAACVQIANKHIVMEEYSQANNILNKAMEFLKKRGSYCGNTVTQVGGLNIDIGDDEIADIMDEQSSVEKFTAQVEAATDELNAIKKEYLELEKRLQRNPNDIAAQSRMQVIDYDIAEVEQKLKVATESLELEKARLAQQAVATRITSNASAISVKDDEAETYGEIIETSAVDMGNKLNAARGFLNNNATAGTSQGQSVGASTVGASRAGAMFGTATNAANNTAGSRASAMFGSSATSTYGRNANPYGGGGNNNSPLGSKADIAKMTSILEQSHEQYNEKLDILKAELDSYDKALLPLLKKRKTASASECLTLDGKIDQLNAKRNKVAHTVKRLRNEIAQLDEQLTLMGKVEFQQDLEAMKGRIQQLTGGKYADIEGLSMYLKDSIAKENAELENLGVSNAVIDSEEINMNSYSGANSSVADMSNVKDEDKYAALERELSASTY